MAAGEIVGRVYILASVVGDNIDGDVRDIARKAGEGGGDEFETAFAKAVRQRFAKTWRGNIFSQNILRAQLSKLGSDGGTMFRRGIESGIGGRAAFSNFIDSLRGIRDEFTASRPMLQAFSNRLSEIKQNFLQLGPAIKSGALGALRTFSDDVRTLGRDHLNYLRASFPRVSDAITRGFGGALNRGRDVLDKYGPALQRVSFSLGQLVGSFRKTAKQTETEGNRIRNVLSRLFGDRVDDSGLDTLTRLATRAFGDIRESSDGAGVSIRRADESSRSFFGRWKTLPAGFRRFSFYVGLFAALGSAIAVLGSAAGSGLAVVTTAALGGAIGLGVFAAAVKGLGSDLADLPAEVRPAAEAFQAFKASLGGLQDAIQASAAGGLQAGFSSLKDTVDALLPTFQAFGELVGRIFSNFAAGIAPGTQGFGVLQALIAGSMPIFDSLITAVINLGEALGNIFLAVLPYATTFSDWLATITGQFATFTQATDGVTAGPLTEWLENGAAVFAAIGPLIAAVADALNNLVNPTTIGQLADLLGHLTGFIPVLGGILQVISNLNVFGIIATALDTVGAAIAPLLPALQTLGTILGGAVITVLEALAPVWAKFADAISPIIKLIGDLVTTSLPPLLAFLEPIWDAFATVAQILTSQLKPAFDGLISALGPLLEAFAPLGSLIADLLLDAIVALLPAIQALSPVFSSIVSSLMPLVPLITDLASDVAGFLVQALTALVPPIVKVIEAIAPLVAVILPPLISLVQSLWPIITTLMDAFMQLLVPVMALLTPLIDLISTILPPLISIIVLVIQSALQPFMVAFQALMPVIMAVIGLILNILTPTIQMITDVLGGVIRFITGVFRGDWEQAWNGIVEIFTGIWNGIKGVAKGAINGVIDVINGLIGAINLIPGLDVGKIGHVAFASGGLVYGPTRATVGEAGPEAIVPLNRPLSQVDPAVRDLSAYAQGLAPASSIASNGGNSRVVNIEAGAVQVIGSMSPEATAIEVVNRVSQKIVG